MIKYRKCSKRGKIKPMDIQAIILAAGKGSRMHSDYPKVLHSLAEKPLINHVLDTCEKVGVNRANVVLGYGASQVKNHLRASSLTIPLSFSLQKEQLGTGDAVKTALHSMDDHNVDEHSISLILYGDVPLIHHKSLKALLKQQALTFKGLTLMTCSLLNPKGYGRILRNKKNNNVFGIIEDKDASLEEKKINEVNTGILCCQTQHLKQWIAQLKNNNAQNEYYLTDIIALAVNSGIKITTIHPNYLFEVEGVNTLKQLANLERTWQRHLADQLMDRGVTLRDPNRFDLRGQLIHESGVIIDTNCLLEGTVVLGKNVKIDSHVSLKNTTVGENTHIKTNTIIEDSVIGKNVSVGPFARLRPKTFLDDSSHVGNFVEMKATSLGKGSKAGHLSYLGNACIGKKVNIGAGTITCNYDGVNKYETIIQDGVFVGSNTQLIAPITVGKNATIGAGSTLVKNVDNDVLCLSRVKQIQMSHWTRPVKKKDKNKDPIKNES
jgi:bifunctional UDP-N-acetylglucosamine pyrophosphorylase/glucosamine-1-phosphate N-acetyltransferase